jgi:hypothetical protein
MDSSEESPNEKCDVEQADQPTMRAIGAMQHTKQLIRQNIDVIDEVIQTFGQAPSQQELAFLKDYSAVIKDTIKRNQNRAITTAEQTHALKKLSEQQQWIESLIYKNKGLNEGLNKLSVSTRSTEHGLSEALAAFQESDKGKVILGAYRHMLYKFLEDHGIAYSPKKVTKINVISEFDAKIQQMIDLYLKSKDTRLYRLHCCWACYEIVNMYENRMNPNYRYCFKCCGNPISVQISQICDTNLSRSGIPPSCSALSIVHYLYHYKKELAGTEISKIFSLEQNRTSLIFLPLPIIRECYDEQRMRYENLKKNPITVHKCYKDKTLVCTTNFEVPKCRLLLWENMLMPSNYANKPHTIDWYREILTFKVGNHDAAKAFLQAWTSEELICPKATSKAPFIYHEQERVTANIVTFQDMITDHIVEEEQTPDGISHYIFRENKKVQIVPISTDPENPTTFIKLTRSQYDDFKKRSQVSLDQYYMYKRMQHDNEKLAQHQLSGKENPSIKVGDVSVRDPETHKITKHQRVPQQNLYPRPLIRPKPHPNSDFAGTADGCKPSDAVTTETPDQLLRTDPDHSEAPPAESLPPEKEATDGQHSQLPQIEKAGGIHLDNSTRDQTEPHIDKSLQTCSAGEYYGIKPDFSRIELEEVHHYKEPKTEYELLGKRNKGQVSSTSFLSDLSQSKLQYFKNGNIL